MFNGLKTFKFKTLPNDILSGIIIALVSIPISMGYAQIAGLPPVYGLYGSVLPVLVFAIFSSSPQYIFGVDAAPAAVIGGVLASLGIASGSVEAIKTVPVITFFTAVWLFIFYITKAGKLTSYVSTPVMGGFISGICATIIMMQIPKLFGGSAGTGEVVELIKSIKEQYDGSFNKYAFLIGGLSIVVILLTKKIAPKVPMSVIIMIGFAIVQYKTDFCTRLSINTLPAVEKGLGSFTIPDFSAISITKALTSSLTVAVIIMAETLLAEKSFANRNGYKINDNNEILTYSLCNLASAGIGCLSVNGSVSRTSMNEQFGGKSQMTSLFAVGSMVLILLFGTGFIQYLPVPVLTAIVICALLGAIELDLAVKLAKVNKKELIIFITAFAGVLIAGTINGVMIGVILSFANVVIRESDPPRSFMGVINGRGGFFSLNDNPDARKVKNAVIYKFNANLFFANVNQFKKDIEGSISDDTKVVIVDASALTSIDTTGAECLKNIYETLKAKGIGFYLCEHSKEVNSLLRKLGLGSMIDEGHVRRTIKAALNVEGISKPYPIEIDESTAEIAPNFTEQLMHEFEWAFGDEANEIIEGFAYDILDHTDKLTLDDDDWQEIQKTVSELWNGIGSFDEDALLEALEIKIIELSQTTSFEEKIIVRNIEQRREAIYQYIKDMDKEAFDIMHKNRHDTMHRLRDEAPETYRIFRKYHNEVVSKRSQNANENEGE